jgi:polyhydroxyalkanoate synthesis regulator protein
MVNVIRSYGSTLQTLVSGHLDQSLKQFLNQQVQGRERAKPIPGLEPPRVRAPQDEAFKSLTNVPTRPRDGDKDRDESNFTK